MNEDIRAKLSAPMTYKYRPGSTTNKRENGRYPAGTKAMMLAFIDARDVMDRLDDVVGVGNWQSDLRQVNPDGSVMVALALRLGDGWVTHVDCGYKNAPDNDSESEPLKAAMSDGLKRAAVRFGVGRFLYDLPSHWAEIDAYGKPLKESSGDVVSQQAQHAPTLMQQAKGAPIATTQAGNGACEVPECSLFCKPEFIEPMKRKYGIVICGKHGKAVKDGLLDIEAVKYDIANGSVTRDVDAGREDGHDPLFQDHARIDAAKNAKSEILDWTTFYSRFRPLGIHNRQDVTRATKIEESKLVDMTPQETADALIAAGVGA